MSAKIKTTNVMNYVDFWGVSSKKDFLELCQ